jgi:hypothetical protein
VIETLRALAKRRRHRAFQTFECHIAEEISIYFHAAVACCRVRVVDTLLARSGELVPWTIFTLFCCCLTAFAASFLCRILEKKVSLALACSGIVGREAVDAGSVDVLIVDALCADGLTGSIADETAFD